MASQSKKNISENKRDTLQFFSRQSQSAQKFIENKENENPQFLSIDKQNYNGKIRNSILTIETISNKKKCEILKLMKPDNDNYVEFVVYDDEEVGISKQFSDKLQEAYDRDDDVQTTDSVQKQLQDICLNDLEEGIQQNLGDKNKMIINLKRIRQHYNQLGLESKKEIKN
ncbi:unnamed protein product (macronuclear) [Paramecium tetraurelia]|uniref:Uncharacterized protein n=1 Tax=Paramecium tetraurelia TaxID=5888 RepID=A0BCX1_PARTE|nr:uncharacterized protein GSPATT00004482001 [Paramecium tetraurelia]CAK56388.1 unnamed protein product [Paramecium tetraurelia]|eukprot:XP_001423786.1 hypothetical protein (macronuclear) [Paramecium tetraurelia strain d4-2]